MYMEPVRIDICLAEKQRAQIDDLAQRTGMTLDEVIGNALDHYLDQASVGGESSLQATFGALPDFSTPSRDEWDIQITHLRD